MSETVVDILHDCNLFSQVDARGFQRLATIARLVKFPKGRVIFRDGEPCPGAYVVGSGLVRVYKTGAGGKEHVLHIIGPGDTFAEVAAVGGFDCPANAEAIAPTTCALLPGDLFRKALQEDHPLCLGMLAGLTFWVRRLVGLMEDVVLRDAAGRVARFLLEAETDETDAITLPGLKTRRQPPEPDRRDVLPHPPPAGGSGPHRRTGRQSHPARRPGKAIADGQGALAEDLNGRPGIDWRIALRTPISESKYSV